MYENSIRKVFANLNIPKQEKVPIKEDLSYDDKIKKAVENLAQYADFHGLSDRLKTIKEEEKCKTDPVFNFLHQLKKSYC